ncbi:hypothetical protein AB0I10_32500 [Streptomyces sp. NPDC050636]|uniref:hypothetical protein n=1 Tax=Streptomyces sp. NPDC050636 TaxID=3154510 RepID=UPI00343FA513
MRSIFIREDPSSPAFFEVFFTVGMLEDPVGGFGPDERVFAVVPVVDERADLGVEVAGAARRA